MPELFVAITGGTCSGKTTLAAGLRCRMGRDLAAISFDDLTIGRPLLEAAGLVVSDWDDPSLYRWEDLRRHLADLSSGRPTIVDARSSESRQAGVSRRHVPARPVIALVGYLALHDPDLASSFDVRVFIDLHEDEMLRRRLTRPPLPHNREPYLSGVLLPAHRRLVVPQRALATDVVDGMLPAGDLVDRVVALINARRG